LIRRERFHFAYRMFKHEPLVEDVVEHRLGHPIDEALLVGFATALEIVARQFPCKNATDASCRRAERVFAATTAPSQPRCSNTS
jgi:hypothetical protein